MKRCNHSFTVAVNLNLCLIYYVYNDEKKREGTRDIETSWERYIGVFFPHVFINHKDMRVVR